MGFIPIFIMLGGAITLFFFTVKSTLQSKVNLQGELLLRLKELNPELKEQVEEQLEPADHLTTTKAENLDQGLAAEAIKLVKEIKINRHQYNQLISKPPYKWVAKFGGFQPI